jgi:signal transduction histidine kinase
MFLLGIVDDIMDLSKFEVK